MSIRLLLIATLLLTTLFPKNARHPSPHVAPAREPVIHDTTTCQYPYRTNKCRHMVDLLRERDSPGLRHAWLEYLRDSVLPCWYGTPWDYNGTTENPGTGKIACGYFVTTVLRDIGVPVKRYQYAQWPSEKMIRALCNGRDIKRFHQSTIQQFVKEVSRQGAGLFVVGLDNHTGFILNDGMDVFFIHASYVGDAVVKSERAAESAVLMQSGYKVLGKLGL